MSAATYTCLSCHIAFSDANGQRDHFQSDWHRYNLMRKLAELPPISREAFKDRALQAESQIAEMAQTKDDKKTYCSSCKKSFANQKSFENHLQSKKHLEKVTAYTEKVNNRHNRALQQQTDSLSKDRVVENFEPSHQSHGKLFCLPCNYTADSQESFYNHMRTRRHMETTTQFDQAHKPQKSITVAGESSSHMDVDSEDDSEEYEEVEWEGDPVKLDDCFFCDHHCSSVQNKLDHMSIEHSFFIPDLEYCSDVTGLIEYLGEKIGCGYECIACNWVGNRCPTLDAVRKHMNDKGHCYINVEGDRILEYEEFYDYSSTYPDAAGSPDDEVEINVLRGDDCELVLPSGATIGHRTLARYYRQKIRPDRSIVVKKTPGRSFINILSQYRALGWHGATQADVMRKQKDLKYMNKMKQRQDLKLRMKSNKMQHHFRNQNPI